MSWLGVNLSVSFCVLVVCALSGTLMVGLCLLHSILTFLRKKITSSVHPIFRTL